MKKVAALIVIGVVAVLGVTAFVYKNSSIVGSSLTAQVAAKPTPPANTAPPAGAAGGDKSIPKTFTLSADSQDEHGDVAFDHDSHAFKNYSPDGKSPIACIECHHTDQPKSALKPPLLTSERDVEMTLASWKASPQKVQNCRSCHFQEGSVPDGKTQPSAKYTDGGKSTTKELTNQLAYHINCNSCHDAAFAARPELKKKPGFATSRDCMVCHKKI